jgi:hypothetical protein
MSWEGRGILELGLGARDWTGIRVGVTVSVRVRETFFGFRV